MMTNAASENTMPPRTTHRPTLLLLLLAWVGLVGLALLCGSVGAVSIEWEDLWHNPIFLNLRLPRLLLAIIAGGGLAVCGSAYQCIFRNPLSDPYLLGVSSGASLGAAIAILLGLNAFAFGTSGCALITALATIALLYKVASSQQGVHTDRLLLTGVCLSLLLSAIVSFLMVLNHDKMDSIVFWTMGSFASAGWWDVCILAPIVLISTLFIRFNAREMNLLLAGGEVALSLGVNVKRVMRTLLFFSSLMVAFAVASCGVIGFVGLIVPHAVRLLTGSDHRKVIPFSFVAGGAFLLACDTAARTLFAPAELPIGSITAIVGAPLFILLLFRNRFNR